MIISVCVADEDEWMMFVTAAGNAFIQAAQLHSKEGNRHEAATQFVDAANCYKKTDTNGNELVSYLYVSPYCFTALRRIRSVRRSLIQVALLTLLCHILGEEIRTHNSTSVSNSLVESSGRNQVLALPIIVSMTWHLLTLPRHFTWLLKLSLSLFLINEYVNTYCAVTCSSTVSDQRFQWPQHVPGTPCI